MSNLFDETTTFDESLLRSIAAQVCSMRSVLLDYFTSTVSFYHLLLAFSHQVTMGNWRAISDCNIAIDIGSLSTFSPLNLHPASLICSSFSWYASLCTLPCVNFLLALGSLSCHLSTAWIHRWNLVFWTASLVGPTTHSPCHGKYTSRTFRSWYSDHHWINSSNRLIILICSAFNPAWAALSFLCLSISRVAF